MIKIFKYTILLLFVSFYVQAQNIDSLTHLLSKTNNTKKIEIYYQLSRIYSGTSPILCIENAKKGLIISQEEKNTFYEGAFCGIMGYAYSSFNNFDSAVFFTLKSIELLEQIDSVDFLANSYSTMGIIYYQSSNYKKALEYNFKALNLNYRINNERKQAVILLNIGAIYNTKGDLDSAIFYFFEALKIFEQNLDSLNTGKTLQNIGILYTNFKDYDNSLKYLKSALNYTNNNPYLTSAIYNNIGICLKDIENYDSSLIFFQKAIELSERTNNSTNLAYAYSNTGQLYETLKKYNKAIEYYKLSYNLRKNSDNQQEIAMSLLHLGSAYQNYNDNKMAYDCFLQACSIAEKIGAKKLILECYSALSDYFFNEKNYKSAFEYLQKSTAIKDSIFDTEKFNLITEMQTKYETEKKEQEILILNQQNDIKDIELKKQRYLKLLLFFIVLFLIIISSLIYNKFRQKKKANIQLKKQKEHITLLNEELNDSNDNLKQLNEQLFEANATKDKFFSIISHDLRNPISVMYATTDVLSKNINNFDKQKIELYLQNMNQATGNIMNLLENLLSWANLQNGKLTIDKKKVNFSEIITNNITLADEIAKHKNIKIIANYDKNISATIDKNMIDTVVRNLISNAIKFSFTDNKIYISAKKQSNFLEFSVKDTGIGIDKETLENIFKINSQHSSKGTNGESGTGLGLILCKEFIERHNGSISVKSKIEKGSEFIVKLPI